MDPKKTHRLPHLPRRPRPAGEAERLSRWFRDRDMELQIRRNQERRGEIHNVPVPLKDRIRKKTDPKEWAGPFHKGVKVGEIRSLVVGYTAVMVDPVFVAVLSEWPPNPEVKEPYSKEKRFLIAKFSSKRYSEPATTTEWITGIEKRPWLHVLSVWNSCDVSAGFLEEGWVEGKLSTEQLADAWEVFRHALTGVPLSDRVRAQVGAPIIHPRDPRIQYQIEEASRFAVLCEGS